MDLETAIDELQTAVEPLLHAEPEGLDELTLMDRLAEAGHPLFQRDARLEPAALYRAHFLLFHTLYRLQPQLAEHGLRLHIHCLDIHLEAAPPGSTEPQALAGHDGVAAFYLDLGNLEGMDNAAVECLIADGLRRAFAAGERSEALAELGLEPGVSWAEIRQRYRRLAMQHHPDRGGDTETLQRINEAYRQLMAGAR